MTRRMLRAFTDHPASVGESYWQHLAFALGFSFKLFVAAVAALVHAVFPFLFKTTASGLIADMASRTGPRRARAGGRSNDLSLSRV